MTYSFNRLDSRLDTTEERISENLKAGQNKLSKLKRRKKPPPIAD